MNLIDQVLNKFEASTVSEEHDGSGWVYKELERLKVKNIELQAKADFLDLLREELGYIECGEGQYLTIGQDDATGSWSIRNSTKEIVWAESFTGLFSKLKERKNKHG